jgi:glycosyltransferase involved in cell wall biosynthesis
MLRTTTAPAEPRYAAVEYDPNPNRGNQPMAPRILHLIDSLRIGGMERVFVSLANGLEERGWSQTVCCLRRAGPPAQDLSKNVRLVEMATEHRQWGLVNRLRRLADRVGADLVHGQNLSTWCDGGRAFAGRLPLVQSFHGFLNPEVSLARRVLLHWLSGRTQRLVAVSESLRHEMAGCFQAHGDSIEVIPNGVDTARFAPRIRGPDERRIRSVVGNRFLCVTVASVSPVKSPDMLVQAARRLSDEVAFVWIGDGPLYDRTRKSIQEAGLEQRFKLLGAQPDVRPFLHAADLFVLPSRTEALPMCVLEAQAIGLPVVATNVGALPEIVLAGHSGLLVEPGNPQALAKSINDLRGQPAVRRDMGGRARGHVAARFGIDRMIDRYEELYQSLIADTTAPVCTV